MDTETLQKRTRDELVSIMEMGISPQMVQRYTGINYKTIYRWERGEYLPGLEDCGRTLKFIKWTLGLYDALTDIVISFDKDKYPPEIFAVMYGPKILGILKTKRLDIGGKITKLLKTVLQNST